MHDTGFQRTIERRTAPLVLTTPLLACLGWTQAACA
jgi:hypothetical protein